MERTLNLKTENSSKIFVTFSILFIFFALLLSPKTFLRISKSLISDHNMVEIIKTIFHFGSYSRCPLSGDSPGENGR